MSSNDDHATAQEGSLLNGLQPLVLRGNTNAVTIPGLVESMEQGNIRRPPFSDEEDIEEEEVENDNLASTSSSDEAEWGRVTNGVGFVLDSSGFLGSSESEEGTMLFVPDPVYQLESLREKPAIPYHSKEELPIGVTVWVVDEEDVATFMKYHWCSLYESVCNGKLSGTVVRHSGNFTLVRFKDDVADLELSLTLPRPCLSLERVVPYESKLNSNIVSLSSGYLNLGPRPQTRRSQAANEVCQQLYERLAILNVSSNALVDLGYAVEKFEAAKFAEALTLVNKALESQSASLQRVEALVLRSRILVFLERFDEALDDANECIALEPQWVRGYVSAARALSGLGQFIEAGNALRRASLQLSYSDDLEHIKEVNNYLLNVQQTLTDKYQCILTIDSLYRKRLKTRRQCEKGTVLCTEGSPLLAMTLLEERRVLRRCCVCFRETSDSGDAHTNPLFYSGLDTPQGLGQSSHSGSGSKGPLNSALFCSVQCQQRSSLYTSMEKKYAGGLRTARQRLVEQLNSIDRTVPPLDLESMNMAIRLLFVVMTTYRRIRSQNSLESARQGELSNSGANSSGGFAPGPSRKINIDTALKHLGVYPLVSNSTFPSEKEVLSLCYDNLAYEFSEKDREVFTKEIFYCFYSYVKSYVVPVTLENEKDIEGVPVTTTVLFLPHMLGCVHHAQDFDDANVIHRTVRSATPSCSFLDSSRTEGLADPDSPILELVADKDLHVGERLQFDSSPADLSKGWLR